MHRAVHIDASGVRLPGDLVVPDGARGVVLFAHGSGSSRHSPRNRQVAAGLHDAGYGTLLLDLLTEDEERVDARTGALRFDIGMLAGRLTGAADWLSRQDGSAPCRSAVFGASTGAAAALITAADRPDRIGAVISRGGRPDLAGDALARVRAPTLLIVGGADRQVLELNRARGSAARGGARHRGGPRRDAPVRGAGRARAGHRPLGPLAHHVAPIRGAAVRTRCAPRAAPSTAQDPCLPRSGQSDRRGCQPSAGPRRVAMSVRICA